MYSVLDYGDMTGDKARTDAYAAALRARVNPESVVLDIGSGAGMLTLLACQAGARRVYSVEPAAVIQVGRENVAANGYADRVEFIQDYSTRVNLPEKVDVIVFSISGVFPYFSGSLGAIIDARDRFLKPCGFLIPARESVWTALVSSQAVYDRIVDPWDAYGLDGSAGRRRALNSWRKWRGSPSDLIVEPRMWSDIDYASLSSVSGKGSVSWTIEEDCDAHGFVAWFDCETAPGIGFSNAPGSRENCVYEQGFFPWLEARRLEAGDEVTIELRADAVGEDYLYSWNTEIRSGDDSKSLKAMFRQSQFLSAPLSEDWLRKSASGFVPSPNEEGRIDKLIFDLLFTGATLEEISQQVSSKFPERFPGWRNALTQVGEMSLRYSL
jgi:protein arginine N-methyltransferase 1